MIVVVGDVYEDIFLFKKIMRKFGMFYYFCFDNRNMIRCGSYFFFLKRK